MALIGNNNSDIGTILTKISAGNFKFGFEQQFIQIQNTTIGRINSEIDKVLKNDTTATRLAALERDYGKLEKNKALIDSFSFDQRNNSLRIPTLQNDVEAAIAAFSTDDDDTNLTADEVATITAKRDELIKNVSALSLSIHPDIATPFVIRDVKNMYDTLKAMDPVAGVVDASGTDPATNGNRQILDDLNTLNDLLSTARDVTDTTYANASNISLNLSATLATKLSDLTQISEVELARREAEIADIKSKYSNILRVISVSFEARIASLEEMNKSFSGFSIEPGSVMNLFA